MEDASGFDKLPYVLQPFQDTALFGVKYFTQSLGAREMQARLRLCPYYFVTAGRANLGGVFHGLPKDKKLIHGMSARYDAVLRGKAEG